MGLGDVALRDTKRSNVSRGEAAQTEKAECILSEISLKIKFKIFLPGWYTAATLWIQPGNQR